MLFLVGDLKNGKKINKIIKCEKCGYFLKVFSMSENIVSGTVICPYCKGYGMYTVNLEKIGDVVFKCLDEECGRTYKEKDVEKLVEKGCKFCGKNEGKMTMVVELDKIEKKKLAEKKMERERLENITLRDALEYFANVYVVGGQETYDAKEHEQILEWLKELKEYREIIQNLRIKTKNYFTV